MDAEEFNQGCGAGGGGGGDLSMGTDEFTPGCGGTGAGTKFTLLASDAKDYLCIPQDVNDQFRHLFPFGPIELEDPDGHVYTVQVVKLGPITLATGWRLFVDENHIQQGDPILFVNCGRYKFKVQRAGPPRVLNEQVAPDPAQVQTSTHDDYDLFPGTCLTIQQEVKVLELAASSMRSGIKLHVAAMKKRNSNKDFYVYIPLRLLDKLKEGITVATIRLEAHGNGMIYAVSASKRSGDQIILKSGLSRFVASLRIQDNDLLVFGSKGKDHLEVRVLDPKGCEKTMANSSNAQQVCEGSVEIVDPPSHTVTDSVIDLSSDDDEVMGEGTTMARREQTPLPFCRAKAQKMPSTSSPYTKSEHKAGKSNEVGLEAPMSHKPYIFTKLDWQHEPEVKEKVHAIESEFPVFVKQMSASDILKPQELYFCMEYAMAVCLPLKPTPVILRLEGSEMQWFSMLVVCKNVRRICSFWKDLVLEAKMKQGDICLVELAERSSESLTMMVHLIRK